MRLFLAASAAAFIAACSQGEVPASERAAVTAPTEDTKALAVLSYADWCGSCKALDPKVTAVQAASVEFAKIDYINRDSDAFFADAETLGVAEAMRATFPDNIKTGRLYLVNLDIGEVIGTVDKSMDETAISEAAALS